MRRSSGRRADIGRDRWDRTGLSNFPDGRVAATFAIAQDAVVGGNDVGFDALIVKAFERLTHVADQGEVAEFLFLWRRRREFHLPEIHNGIKKSNAVGVDAGVLTDLADHADFRFFIALGPAKNHFLFGGKLVPGKKAGAMEAEENGLRFLGENLARQIRTDQDDGDLFGDASASAHNLLWQEEGHTETAAGPISYPGLTAKLSVISVKALAWDAEQV